MARSKSSALAVTPVASFLISPLPGDLEAVGAVVLEALGLEELVQLGDGVLQLAGHGASVAARAPSAGVETVWSEAKRSVWDTAVCVGAWRSLVARAVRVGEVPGSNPGAPICRRSANGREQGRNAGSGGARAAK